jgi:hypothetical protein
MACRRFRACAPNSCDSRSLHASPLHRLFGNGESVSHGPFLGHFSTAEARGLPVQMTRISKSFCLLSLMWYASRTNFTNLFGSISFLFWLGFFVISSTSIHTIFVQSLISRSSHLAPLARGNFEGVLLRFCSHNPWFRKYFLKSDALLHVRDILMRQWGSMSMVDSRYCPHTLSLHRPQSLILFVGLSVLQQSENAAKPCNRLISCGVRSPGSMFGIDVSTHSPRPYSQSHLRYRSQEPQRQTHGWRPGYIR